ncbi:MAG TPA: hypothetical protein VNK89_00700, partial [Thermoflexus sp.]|nr:hypothetical protein [Thermoflexus sp.]
TPQATPLDYARAQNNLGGTYQELAAHEDPVGNLWRAIAAYEEALRFYTPQATPLEYARTQHNLGLACLALANVETDTERGCEVLARAIRAFQEALRFRTPEATPRWHAETRKALEEALEKARAWGCPEASPYA